MGLRASSRCRTSRRTARRGGHGQRHPHAALGVGRQVADHLVGARLREGERLLSRAAAAQVGDPLHAARKRYHPVVVALPHVAERYPYLTGRNR